MKRDWDMDAVTDGRLYTKDDIAKIDCKDCKGCSDCCHDMGESVVLDPYDMYMLTTNLGVSFAEMLDDKIELNVVDNVILPNLKMSGETEDACGFLDENDRCSIHGFRPGICRLFPLGRIYEGDSFKYFVQIHECRMTDRDDMVIRDFLGVPNMKKYEKYISAWHKFRGEWEKLVLATNDFEEKKNAMLYLVMLFYQRPYDGNKDFYPQFYERIKIAETML